MHLYQASPSHAGDLLLLIFEVLKDDAHYRPLTSTDVTRNSIIHVERIPSLSKVYVVEPAVKQIVLTNNLHEVSRVVPFLVAHCSSVLARFGLLLWCCSSEAWFLC